MNTGDNKKVIGYYASWSIYDRKYFIEDIPVENLTHINYAFAQIIDGKIAHGDNWADADKPWEKDPSIKGNLGQLTSPNGPARRRNPNLKTLISVGGWSYSKYFSLIASDYEQRKKFNLSVLEYLKQYQLDGVDIDWEFPVVGGKEDNFRSPEDGVNFVSLLYELRQLLDGYRSARGERYLLTVATSAARYNYQYLKLKDMANYLDWFNVMCYDFSGPWSPVCHHHCNLYPDPNNTNQLSCSVSLQDYMSQGVPPHQLVLGIPFYARAFSGLPTPVQLINSTGYGCTYTSLPQTPSEPGVYQYFELVNDHLDKIIGTSTKTPIYWRFFNDITMATHLFKFGQNEFIGLEDMQSINAKVKFVKGLGISGFMIWELYGDRQNRLLPFLYEKFCGNRN